MPQINSNVSGVDMTSSSTSSTSRTSAVRVASGTTEETPVQSGWWGYTGETKQSKKRKRDEDDNEDEDEGDDSDSMMPPNGDEVENVEKKAAPKLSENSQVFDLSGDDSVSAWTPHASTPNPTPFVLSIDDEDEPIATLPTNVAIPDNDEDIEVVKTVVPLSEMSASHLFVPRRNRKALPPPRDPMLAILEVFPDVDRQHVKGLLHKATLQAEAKENAALAAASLQCGSSQNDAIPVEISTAGGMITPTRSGQLRAQLRENIIQSILSTLADSPYPKIQESETTDQDQNRNSEEDFDEHGGVLVRLDEDNTQEIEDSPINVKTDQDSEDGQFDPNRHSKSSKDDMNRPYYTLTECTDAIYITFPFFNKRGARLHAQSRSDDAAAASMAAQRSSLSRRRFARSLEKTHGIRYDGTQDVVPTENKATPTPTKPLRWYTECHSRICSALMGLDSQTTTQNDKKFMTEEDEIDEEAKMRLFLKAVGDKVLTDDQIHRLKMPSQKGNKTSLVSTVSAVFVRKQQKTVPESDEKPTEAGNINISLTNLPPVLPPMPPLPSKETQQNSKLPLVLRREIRAAYAAQQKRIDELNDRIRRRHRKALSERDGTSMECPICCETLPLEDMISCRDEGHLLCADCVRRYAEERIFGLGSLRHDNQKDQTNKGVGELKCVHPDGCSSSFTNDMLRRALGDRVFKKYEELRSRVALETAHIEGLAKCPKCNYVAILPPTEMIFHCPVRGCRHKSCRKCGEPSHVPLKCTEVERRKDTDARRTVEEAMTKAKIRVCPKPMCGKSFFKSDGCNKIQCACGTFVCYVCRKEIPAKIGYSHFCQKPHCKHESCGKCPLYTKSEEDDRRAIREAGLKAADEVGALVRRETDDDDENTRDEQSNDGPLKKRKITHEVIGGDNSDDSRVRVDVDALLRDPPNATARPN